MRKISLLAFILFLFCCNVKAQDKFSRMDSALKVLKSNYKSGWTFSRFGSRIIATKNDSVYVATSFSDYKPGKYPAECPALKFRYQMYIDFYEPDFEFTGGMYKMINDSLDKLIRSFRKKKYGRGEYFMHLEAVETLERMKWQEPVHLLYFDIRFSDNCAADWIPYVADDMRHAPFLPPTSFQTEMRGMKENIGRILKTSGI